MPRPAYVTITIAPDARDALRRITLTQSARVGRRLSMGAVLFALAVVGELHPDEVSSALANGDPA